MEFKSINYFFGGGLFYRPAGDGLPFIRGRTVSLEKGFKKISGFGEGLGERKRRKRKGKEKGRERKWEGPSRVGADAGTRAESAPPRTRQRPG